MTRGRVLGVVMVPCMHTDDFDSEKGRNVIRIVWRLTGRVREPTGCTKVRKFLGSWL